MLNLAELLSAIRSGKGEDFAQDLMKTNPRFKKFVEDNKNKSVQDICKENGVDINQVKSIIG